MRLLGMFFFFVASVVSSSAQTLPLPPAPDPSPAPSTTNAETSNAETAVAVTNPPDTVVLQQLMEKIEKIEAKTETQQNDQVDKLQSQLFEAKAELDSIRETEAANRSPLWTLVFVLIALTVLAILGLIAFCVYALRRVTDISAPIFDSLHHQRHPALPYGSPAGALSPHANVEDGPPSGAVTTRGESRLLDAVDRLERKIEEIERVAHHDNHLDVNPGTVRPATSSIPPDPTRNHRHADRFVLFLNKGEAHANLQQFEKAIECFEQAIVLEPEDPSPVVKKGYALEKLGRLDEAVQCYDQSLVLDPTYSMAYLFKGGICNRLQRYAEAIECYDRALAVRGNDA